MRQSFWYVLVLSGISLVACGPKKSPPCANCNVGDGNQTIDGNSRSPNNPNHVGDGNGDNGNHTNPNNGNTNDTNTTKPLNPNFVTTGSLFIPPLLQSTTEGAFKAFDLTMQTGTTQLIAGVNTSTMGFNGSYLGPTIRVTNGDAVQMHVTNNIGTIATVHWHGLHITPVGDGGVQDTIAPGATWNPNVTIKQQAATLWYHPHTMGETAQQVSAGLTGMFIIDDNTPVDQAMPHTYGVDDIPLIVQAQMLDSSGAIISTDTGAASDVSSFILVVNGTNANQGPTPTLDTNTNRMRLRILNGSIGSVITFSYTDGAPLTQVASDGGYLATALDSNVLTLGPAERASIILDPNGQHTLQATATSLLRSVGVAPTTSASLLTITGTTPPQNANALPTALNTINPYNLTAQGVVKVAVNFASTSNNTIFTIGLDGNTPVAGTTIPAMEANSVHIPLGSVAQWTVTNTTVLDHYFHVHDVEFLVTSFNGAAPTGMLAGWKDTVRVPANETVVLGMQFLDYADDSTAYMLHCHIVPHEDEGMMAFLYIDPS